MRFKLFALMLAIPLAMPLSGCIQTRMYVAERPRVDQDLPGYHGFAKEAEPVREKTRQVVVLEVSEKGKGTPATVATPGVPASEASAGTSKVVAEPKDTVVVHQDNFTFPQMTGDELSRKAASGEGAQNVTYEQYTVQKDDTLQKIAKKYYGSYNQWMKVYDANRDVIKDPNFLKPGKVLRIPLQP